MRRIRASMSSNSACFSFTAVLSTLSTTFTTRSLSSSCAVTKYTKEIRKEE